MIINDSPEDSSQLAIQKRLGQLSGSRDSRGRMGIAARGKNVYNAGSSAANRGLGSLGGITQPALRAASPISAGGGGRVGPSAPRPPAVGGVAPQSGSQQGGIEGSGISSNPIPGSAGGNRSPWNRGANIPGSIVTPQQQAWMRAISNRLGG